MPGIRDGAELCPFECPQTANSLAGLFDRTVLYVRRPGSHNPLLRILDRGVGNCGAGAEVYEESKRHLSSEVTSV